MASRSENDVSNPAFQEDVYTPPRYTVDLSLPPEERYKHIAEDFREEIKALPSIFDEILKLVRFVPRPLLILASWLLLRRLYDPEEHREIKGISKVTAVPIYLLVAFNVLLDLFMGCTSGGARVNVDSGPSTTKMLHFRTLDWGMDPLRKVVVELNFVERAGGPVIATSITYFGYVGVLTGVRKGLSVSLNFRPTHDRSSLRKRVAFRFHQLMVLLGRRRSIASVLRQCLLPKDTSDLRKAPREIAEMLEPQKSTAAYLTFCDGKTTVCMDQDHKKARIDEASDFIFVVNHDYTDEQTQAIEELRRKHGTADEDYLSDRVMEEYKRQNKVTGQLTGALDLVEFSMVRKNCITSLWARDRLPISGKEGDGEFCVREVDVVKWLDESAELTNEETHYGVVMDPTEGKIVWLERYLEPLQFDTESGAAEAEAADGTLCRAHTL